MDSITLNLPNGLTKQEVLQTIALANDYETAKFDRVEQVFLTLNSEDEVVDDIYYVSSIEEEPPVGETTTYLATCYLKSEISIEAFALKIIARYNYDYLVTCMKLLTSEQAESSALEALSTKLASISTDTGGAE